MGVGWLLQGIAASPDQLRIVKALLDTHFVIWIATGAERLAEFSWIDRYRPWGVSPVTLLEIQFLAEIGRIKVQNPEFSDVLAADSRFVIDEVPMVPLIRRAMELTWTRDPFDRLIAAHSSFRRLPLCTTDRVLRSHHAPLAEPPRAAT
jgi:PIN domain nuclease of toxin-antitoxin system